MSVSQPAGSSAPDGERALPALTPDAVALAHLELLLSGAYPLPGFMSASESVLVRTTGRLADGQPWPVPVTLAVPERLAEAPEVLLTDPEGAPLARLTVTERWWANGQHRLAGTVKAIEPPVHGVFRRLRRSPGEVRAVRPGTEPLLAVVARGPLHHRALAQIRDAATRLGAEAGAASAEVLVLVDTPFHDERAARAVLAAEPHLPEGTRIVAVTLPGGDPDAGTPLPPGRDAMLAAHVAAAYGATHVMIEPAPPDVTALPDGDTPIPVLDLGEWRYDPGAEAWRPASLVETGRARAEPTGEEIGELLAGGIPLPGWFTPNAVAEEMAARHPPRSRRGLTVFFTGLSGSGKSTVARGVADHVREAGRTVTLLDGDVVRRMLSAGLTFSRADRDLNIRRIGYVAAEITRHGGIAICAPIAPYAATRAEVRAMVEEAGDMFLVHVATPLEVCEARDRKGLYAKARAGEIPEFTGVSDPYEVPDDADLRLDTSEITIAEAVERVVARLREGGWLPR